MLSGQVADGFATIFTGELVPSITYKTSLLCMLFNLTRVEKKNGVV